MVEGINWTSGLDPKTGKPTINEAMKPKQGGGQVQPIGPGLEGGTYVGLSDRIESAPEEARPRRLPA